MPLNNTPDELLRKKRPAHADVLIRAARLGLELARLSDTITTLVRELHVAWGAPAPAAAKDLNVALAPMTDLVRRSSSWLKQVGLHARSGELLLKDMEFIGQRASGGTAIAAVEMAAEALSLKPLSHQEIAAVLAASGYDSPVGFENNPVAKRDATKKLRPRAKGIVGQLEVQERDVRRAEMRRFRELTSLCTSDGADHPPSLAGRKRK